MYMCILWEDLNVMYMCILWEDLNVMYMYIYMYMYSGNWIIKEMCIFCK